jgi:Mn-dependent DtxR family transcriptional regulator
MTGANPNSAPWTPLQGQYLAFIYAYTTIHGQAPAERDIQEFFQVTPPSIHNMMKLLQRHGFIRRQPGVARSIQLLVPPEKLPVLQRHK